MDLLWDVPEVRVFRRLDEYYEERKVHLWDDVTLTPNK